MGEKKAYKILVGKPPETRWEDTVKMDLRRTLCEDGRWLDLAQDRVRWLVCVLAVLNLP